MKCKTCNLEKELRMEICFNCAEAESIIATGLDMYDRGLNRSNIPAFAAIDKVKLLVQSGWSYTEKSITLKLKPLTSNH